MKANKRNSTYKRGNPSNKALNRPIDFRRLRVLALSRSVGDAMTLTLALSGPDAILAGIAVTDALTIASCGVGAVVTRPVIEQDGEPALIVRLQAPPPGIEVGASVDVSAVFRLADLYDVPAVEAVISTIRVRRRPTGPAKITLPEVGAWPALTDADVGLTDDPVAQDRAERMIRAAVGYRLHEEAKTREAARKAAVYVQVDDDALFLAHRVDRDIHRELVRLTSNASRSRKVATGTAA